MMNFGDNYLWIIILLCCCGGNICDILPLLLVLEYCGGCGGNKMFTPHGGCGCK